MCYRYVKCKYAKECTFTSIVFLIQYKYGLIWYRIFKDYVPRKKTKCIPTDPHSRFIFLN